MRSFQQMRDSFRCAPAWLAVLAGGSMLVLACSANKNRDERERIAAQSETDDSCHPCIDTCYPDPGPRKITPEECERAEQGLEFFPIWDFESGTGEYMYTYDDGSTRYIEPSGWEPVEIADVADTAARGWQPTANADGPCDSDHALNVRGGPFMSWGGGIGISMRWIWENGKGDRRGCQSASDSRPEYCPDEDAEYANLTLDMSQWDGLSL